MKTIEQYNKEIKQFDVLIDRLCAELEMLNRKKLKKTRDKRKQLNDLIVVAIKDRRDLAYEAYYWSVKGHI